MNKMKMKNTYTPEEIKEIVSDTLPDGKYVNLLTMIKNEVEAQLDDEKIAYMIDILDYYGVDYENLSKVELLLEFSKLP